MVTQEATMLPVDVVEYIGLQILSRKNLVRDRESDAMDRGKRYA